MNRSFTYFKILNNNKKNRIRTAVLELIPCITRVRREILYPVPGHELIFYLFQILLNNNKKNRIRIRGTGINSVLTKSEKRKILYTVPGHESIFYLFQNFE